MPADLLSGLRVLDLSIWRPGPYATSLLVPLGADVLKVEPPGGDPMRHYAELFSSINGGKRSIVLDLKAGHDRAQAHELVAQADVLVEGFRPGVMARLGLDEPTVRAAHPALVYCSISGYGQRDPRAALPGHDVNYQAWAGALAPEGGVGRMAPLPVADLAAGLTAAFGICAAVLGRRATGTGTYLDVSMTDVLATWTGRVGSADEGEAPSGPVPGYGLFTTSDGGQVALGVLSEQHFWSALCRELGLDELGALDFAARSARGPELQRAVRAAIGSHPRDDLVDALVAAKVPVAPVLDRAGMLASAPFPAFPIRLDRTGPARPVPELDEHRGQGFGQRR
jgi:crotonobetainyl-CoA:carnitine CoA-transferase CaiB-like acyl-CoA transferase